MARYLVHRGLIQIDERHVSEGKYFLMNPAEDNYLLVVRTRDNGFFSRIILKELHWFCYYCDFRKYCFTSVDDALVNCIHQLHNTDDSPMMVSPRYARVPPLVHLSAVAVKRNFPPLSYPEVPVDIERRLRYQNHFF